MMSNLAQKNNASSTVLDFEAVTLVDIVYLVSRACQIIPIVGDSDLCLCSSCDVSGARLAPFIC